MFSSLYRYKIFIYIQKEREERRFVLLFLYKTGTEMKNEEENGGIRKLRKDETRRGEMEKSRPEP